MTLLVDHTTGSARVLVRVPVPPQFAGKRVIGVDVTLIGNDKPTLKDGMISVPLNVALTAIEKEQPE